MKDKLRKYEILFHLAAQDIIHFSTYDSVNENYGKYFTPYVLCNDTFYYASADAEEIDLGEVELLEDVYNKFDECGVVAWCSLKRGEQKPLKELISDKYHDAMIYLKDKTIKVEKIEAME